MHPAGADAAIHAGTALRKENDKGMLVSVALGFYGAKEALKGKHFRSTSTESLTSLLPCLSTML